MDNVLILTNNDVGLYKFRREFIQKLIDQGNHVSLSLPYGEFVPLLKNMGCEYIETDIDRRGINPLTDFKLFMAYVRIIKACKPDFIITYTIKPNIYGGFACRISKIDYAVNITGLGTAFERENILKKVVMFLYKVACKRSKVVFFENMENQQLFIENHIIKKEIACKLNGAGVNLEEFQMCKYPENNNEIRFLFVGRIMKEKGIEELFYAARKIKAEYKNVFFDIIGIFEDDYEKKIEELSKQHIIHYYGFQTDVKPYMKRAHCIILASYHEGMSNTLLEAGAMGRPLIVTNIYGCKEAVVDGKTGFLVTVRDQEDLLWKIKQFIHLSYVEKLEMGIKSHEHISQLFDRNKIVNHTIDKLFN